MNYKSNLMQFFLKQTRIMELFHILHHFPQYILNKSGFQIRLCVADSLTFVFKLKQSAQTLCCSVVLHHFSWGASLQPCRRRREAAQWFFDPDITQLTSSQWQLWSAEISLKCSTFDMFRFLFCDNVWKRCHTLWASWVFNDLHITSFRSG